MNKNEKKRIDREKRLKRSSFHGKLKNKYEKCTKDNIPELYNLVYYPIHNLLEIRSCTLLKVEENNLVVRMNNVGRFVEKIENFYIQKPMNTRSESYGKRKGIKTQKTK